MIKMAAKLTATIKMELTKFKEKLATVKTDSERQIAELLLNFGFEPIDVDAEIPSPSGKPIGEIDCIFRFENYLFIVGVDKSKNHNTDKRIAFFSRWSDESSADLICKKYDLGRKKGLRLYFDLYHSTPKKLTDTSEQIKKLTGDGTFNKMAYIDDYDYFLKSYGKIGQWAKNDFLDWLGYPTETSSKAVPAIQYYIGEIPVLCFVGRVYDLLRTCYISRRRKNDEGYQRTLDTRRIGQISRSIMKGEGLIFPNSILVNVPTKISEKLNPIDCPKVVEMHFPTSYCTCRIIDGQHRLLGFSKQSEEVQRDHFLPVIALEKYSEKQEVKTFVEINSKQQRIDRNLIYLLKEGFEWEEGTREFKEKVIVQVAKELNLTIFKERIFFGTADEQKGQKITLSALVSSMIQNNIVKSSFEDTLTEVNTIISRAQVHMHEHIFGKNAYFASNQGINVLFRVLYLLRRNGTAGTVRVTEEDFFKDLSGVFDVSAMRNLKQFYGQGGSTIAAKHLLLELAKAIPGKYGRLEVDLRLLPRVSG